MNELAASKRPAQIAARRLEGGGQITLASAPEGYDSFLVAELALAFAAAGETRAVALAFIARDGQRAQSFIDALAFAAPEVEALYLPAWDCQPYDRVSPNAAIAALRMTAFARLARTRGAIERPRALVTTINALTQRAPPIALVGAASFSAAPGNSVDTAALTLWLETNGYSRASTVRDVGDYAMRGGILDLYAPGAPAPVRLDFFGDTLESIRAFDPETQRSTGQLRALDLVAMSEAQLTSQAIRRFRQAYVAEFGGQTHGDQLYEAVSEGRRHAGFEHWLPLFFERMDTLFDYLGPAPIILDARAEEAADARFKQIADYYEARRAAYDDDPIKANYRPLKPDRLYLSPDEWRARLEAAPLARLTPFAMPPGESIVDCGARAGRNFAAERVQENVNVFDAAVAHIGALRDGGKRVVVAGWTDGSRERLSHVLAEHGLKNRELVSSLAQAKAAPAGAKGTAMGLYSSLQFIGIFVGGVIGGFAHQTWGDAGVFAMTAVIALAWLLAAATMAQPSYLTTRLVPITGGQAGNAESLAAKLRQVPGVAEAVVIAEEKLAYLKVDSRSFDAAMAEALAGAP